MKRERLPLTAQELDDVTFTATDGAGLARSVRGQGSGGGVMIASTLASVEWSFALLVARSVEERFGTAWNDCGFRYPVDDQLDPGETRWQGVHVYNPVAEAYVAEAAFERLMVRWLRAVVVAAERCQPAHVDARELAAIGDRIEARLRDEAART